MAIEPNVYLTALENKVVYDKTFKMLETNEDNPWTRFFRQNNIQVSGRSVEFLLTWPKDGPEWKPDLSIHKGNDFKREVNAIPFRLPRLLDTVEYEIINEERFTEALESESACKDFTKTLLEQTVENIELRLEEKIPALICNDDNFVPFDDTTGKGNLHEEKEADFWNEPIKILKALFNGSSILRKRSADFNKGYQKDPDDKAQGYTPMETKIRSYSKMVVLLDSKVKNTIEIGGYEDNVNFNALDLEKRFGKENIIEDNLPNDYGMVIMDERCLQLYKRGGQKGFKHKEEAENGNQWFFLNPVIHGGFITAFGAMAWKIDKS